MGYTDGQEVAAALGLTYTSLSPDQQALCDQCADAATAYLDRKMRRSFPAAAAVTNELHPFDGPALYLNETPVLGIDAVRARYTIVGAAPWQLVAMQSYELLDAATGLLLVLPLGDPVTSADVLDLWQYGAGWLFSVDYRYGSPVPADVRLAALELASTSFQAWQAPDIRLYKSISIGQLTVSIGQIGAASSSVAETIANYRRVVLA